MRKLKAFLWQGILLTLTAFLIQAVGIAFNIYLSNKLGANGIGLFQLIMSIYSFAITFATAGIHLAATRLVAEEMANHSSRGAKKAMRVCFIYSLVAGGTVALLLCCFANYISIHWLHDVRCVFSLRTMALSIPFICATAALNGYFMAMRQIGKNASEQILGTFARVIFSIIALSILMPAGLEYACLAVALGGTAAEVLSFIYSYLLYRRDLNRHQQRQSAGKHIAGRMLYITLPVTFSSCIRSGLNTLEQLMIPPGLQKSGMTSTNALAQYGMVHGMAVPVIMFPACFLYAFTSLLVPELTECLAQTQNKRIRMISTRVIELSLIFAIGVAGLLIAYADNISSIFFHTSQVAYYIKLLAPLVILMYLDHAVDCMLKGLNEQVYSMRYNIIDSIMSVALVYLLLPLLGIHGYIIVLFASEMLNTTLSLNRLVKVVDFKIKFGAWFLKPALAISLSVFLVKSFSYIIHLPELSALILLAGSSGLCYLAFLYILDCAHRRDFHFAKSIFHL
ncbi:MAG: oligosaccharide flippase family protein [Clostridia bacterium]|nr:oligosaccharide flippase family protein [Clostridia bacterium]